MGGGSLSCVCVWPAGRAWGGSGGGSLCSGACKDGPVPPLQAPGSLCRSPGGFHAPPCPAGAGALCGCSTASLPGEGSTAPGKGELHLGSPSRRDPCSPATLGALPGLPAVSLVHRTAQLYPTPSPCITFWGDPGTLPWPRRCDMGQSTSSMLLATAASVPSPCRAAEPPAGLHRTRCPAPTWRVARGDGDGRGVLCPGGDGRGGRGPHCPSSGRGHARLLRCSPPAGMGTGMVASARPQRGLLSPPCRIPHPWRSVRTR